MKTNQRAYSLMTIKAVNDDLREITGLASTPESDRMGDIVVAEGAEFTLPIPLLWQHDPSQPIGEVYAAKVTPKGIEIKARLVKLVDAPQDLMDMLDSAWAMIKSGLVKGLSIGFRAVEYSFLDSGGVKFTKWDWYELSAVTIPANAQASIATVKSLDHRADLAASGAKEKPAVKAKTSGVSGTIQPVKLLTSEKETVMTLKEQIEAFKKTLAIKSAALAALATKSGDSGATMNAAEQEEFDTLAGELEQIENQLKRLAVAEKASLSGAVAVTAAAGNSEVKAVEVRQAAHSVPAQVRLVDTGEKGVAFARLAKCKALARMEYMPAHEIATKLYPNDNRIANILKTAVSAATTTGTTNASPLVPEEAGVFADFVEYLRPQTILGKFGAAGVPSLRKVPFRSRLIGQTSGGSAAWVGEAASKPVTHFDFSATTLDPLKVAAITVASMELLRDSSPNADVILRDSLAAAVRERLDIDFISPSKAASAGISPASITNGVTTIHSTGGTADDIRCDIATLLGTYIAANNTPTSGVLIMSALTAMSIGLLRNPLGQKEFPDINMNGGVLEGIPVITSEYVPTVSAGGYVVMVNAQDIYVADDGDVAVDISDQASIQMDTAPTNEGNTPTATSLVSFWQDNLVGFRAERTMNWKKRRTGAVAVLDHVNWGACS